MKKALFLLFIATNVVASTAFATLTFRQGNIEIINPRIQASDGENAILSMEIVNHGDQYDKLTQIQTNISQLSQIHLHEFKNGQLSFKKIGFIEIPANGNKVLSPNGEHIFLTHINHPLREGETASVMLTFEEAGGLRILAPIRNP